MKKFLMLLGVAMLLAGAWVLARAQTTTMPYRSFAAVDYWPIGAAQMLYDHANLGGM